MNLIYTGIILLFSFQLIASISPIQPTINIQTIFYKGVLYSDGETVTIASYTYAPSELSSNDPPSFKVGIFDEQEGLLDALWEYPTREVMQSTDIVQSITVLDLNHDNHMDMLIQYTESDGDLPDQHITTLLIQTDGSFKELPETFISANFTQLPSMQIQYKSSLSLFGKPYLEEDDSETTVFWVDFYEVQGTKLVNINKKHQSFFIDLNNNANAKMNTLFHLIKTYDMSNEKTMHQIQLEEYFNQIIDYKTIIYRSKKIIQ